MPNFISDFSNTSSVKFTKIFKEGKGQVAMAMWVDTVFQGSIFRNEFSSVLTNLVSMQLMIYFTNQLHGIMKNSL